MPFLPETIQAFLRQQRHPLTDQAATLSEDLAVHARGAPPTKLLRTARPNEAQAYQEYRIAVYEPITGPSFDKIHGQVARLRRAQGLTVDLPAEPLSATVRTGEGPREYLLEDYPEHDSVLTWLFTYATRELLADPNALCVVLPREGRMMAWPADATGAYLTPVASIYPAGDVLDYVAGEWAAVVLSRTITYTAAGVQKDNGVQLLLVDKTDFYIITQTGAATQDYVPSETRAYPHGTGTVPAVLLGSTTVIAARDGRTVFASFLSPCLPHWNEAVRRYSDHQVNMALHLHPEKVMKVNTPCNATGCQSGRVRANDPDAGYQDRACGNCHGSGFVSVTTPFGVHIVPPMPKTGINDAGSMPAGELIQYVQKPTNDLDFLKKEYRDQLDDALDAVGLSYLSEVALNQSGTAKAYDRSEINVFFASIARHLTDNLLRPITWYVLQQRYWFIEQAQRDAWYEHVAITVPDTFDVVGLDYYRQRVQAAATNKEPAALQTAAQLEYAAKEYGAQSLAYRLLAITAALDPLPGLNPTEKADAVLAELVSRLDGRVSVQLPALVRRAMEADKKFLEADFDAQRTAVYGLAKADMAAIAPVPLAPAA